MHKGILTAAILSLALAPACAQEELDHKPLDGGGEGGGGGGGDTDEPDDTDEPPGEDTGEEGEETPPDGTDGGTDDGEDDGGDFGWGGGCGTDDYHFTFDLVPPNVMFVLDKSGSMLTRWDHDDDPTTDDVTRWHSLYDVTATVLDTFANRMRFGAKLFPSMEADGGNLERACIVDALPEVPVSGENAADLLASIPGPNNDDISGGTPATAGVEVATEHLAGLDDNRRDAMILVTDGAANCMDGVPYGELASTYDEYLAPTVGSAYVDQGIPTYVVGINIVNRVINTPGNPVVNPFLALNDVAEAGGVPHTNGAAKFYNAFDEIELGDALEDVAARIECTIRLEIEPRYPNFVEVWIGDELVPRVTDCETEDGWVFTNGTNSLSIEVCGESCGWLQENLAADVIYGCPAT